MKHFQIASSQLFKRRLQNTIDKGNKHMSNQQAINNQKQSGKYQQGLGSRYHEEHASHVPDYGANIVDPNAQGLINNTNNTNQ